MNDECSLSPDISALKEIKLKNVNRLVIGQLNLKGISRKLESRKSFICKYIDILIIIELEIDSSFTPQQLFVDGFSIP